MADQLYMPTSPEAVAMLRNNQPTGAVAISQDFMLQRDTASAAMLEYWDLTDAIIDGVKAVKDGGSKWLPRFDGEEQGDYNNRLNCVKMTNVYRDGVEGLSSKPFEQEVSLVEDENTKPPKELKEFCEDVDGAGNNLTVYASQTFFNGVNSAINWIFVDAPPVDPTIVTVADAKRIGLRPYWSHVLGRNVLAATNTVIAGEETLTYIRIFEPGKPDNIRVFERLDTGVVIWTLYEKRDAWRPDGTDANRQTQFWEIDSGVVTIGVIPLIPFITGRRDGRTFKILPALRDAADLQINLYQNESGLEWLKRISAYPMLSGNGIRPDKEPDGKIKKLMIGPNKVLYAPPDGQGKNGEWKYVQPDASILTFLAKDNNDTILQLRELVKQPLTAQSGNLTVITTAVAAGKAASACGAWALSLKDALENAMVITCMFKGIDKATYDPTVFVYTDFDQFAEGDLEALASARQTKDISGETYRAELKRRKVLSDEVDEETEVERLLKEVPSDDGEDTGSDPQTNPARKPNPKPKGQNNAV